MADIGKRIRLKREEMGITQEDLANILGYKNKSTIAKIENGTNDIVQSKVKAFAKALDTTVSYLMGWEEDHPKVDTFSLSPFEEQIIIEYRKADDISKAMVLRALYLEQLPELKGDIPRMA